MKREGDRDEEELREAGRGGYVWVVMGNGNRGRKVGWVEVRMGMGSEG